MAAKIPGGPAQSRSAGINAPRKLAAILAADVAGYSRLTGIDEEGTIKRLRKLRRELINPAVSLHRGRIVGTVQRPVEGLGL
jgi:class 3 adenylate cyclase